MAQAPAKKAAPKVFHPNWDKIMEVLGTPKQEATFVSNMSPEQMDGSWDFVAAQRGLGMRRVAADIGKSTSDVETPCGMVFICQCGYARRVIDSEFSFTCERPNAKGEKGCGIIWEKELYESDEIDPKTGNPLKKPVLEERMSIGKVQRKYLMPKIKGRYVADMRRETYEARKAAGQAASVEMQPQTFGEKEKVPFVIPERQGTSALGSAHLDFKVPEAPTPSVGGDE